jgi:ring-1,2-phenylacetyl-CoA epoxidase subunit PaaC
LYSFLQHSADGRIAAIAAKALKEVTYHLRWAGEWVVRLGAGTAESHARMVNAANTLQPFVTELFVAADYEQQLSAVGLAADLALLRPLWQANIAAIFEKAKLLQAQPQLGKPECMGKNGAHTQHLAAILNEMQLLPRTYPGAAW